MTEPVVNSFYADHPWLGVRFDRQIHPWKDNTSALSPLVSAAFVDPNTLNNTQDFLSYLASGNASKRYRFRSGYNQDLAAYAIQVNTGTDIAQVWVNYLLIDEATGTVTADLSNFYAFFTVTETDGSPTIESDRIIFNSDSFYITKSSSNKPIINFSGSASSTTTAANIGAGTGLFSSKVGDELQFKSLVAGTNITLASAASSVTINSTGGSGDFYGVLFKESEVGGYSKRSDALVFDSNSFYLSTDGDGRPLVSLISPSGAVSSTFSLSTEWQLTHNLGSKELFWTTFDDRDEAIIPQRVDVSNPNITYFYYAAAESGFAIVTRGNGGSGGGGTTDAANVGAGTGLFAQKSVNTLQFKSLVAGQNIAITNDADEVFIAANIDKFYGINVSNYNPTNESFRGIGTVKFDSTYFYLDQNAPNTDEVLVSFKPAAISNIVGPGFYGVVFKETEAGGAKFKKDTITFDSRYFYLSSGGDRKPVLSMARSNIELLAKYSPSAASSVDIISVIDSTIYRSYIIRFRLTPSVDDSELWLRTSTNNGTSFDAAASDYSFSGSGNIQGTAATFGDIADDNIGVAGNASASNSIGSATNEHASGAINIETLGDATKYPMVTYHTSWMDATATTRNSNLVGSGIRRSAAAINAVRLLMESGTLTGVVEVYGLPII